VTVEPEDMHCNIVFAAGGTGGHIVPALVVARSMLREFPEARASFIGVGKPIERKLIVEREGLPYSSIEFHPVVGKGLSGLVSNAMAFPGSVLRTRKLFSQLKPSALIGFGGYPCFVPAFTAFISGIPVFLHEQNVKSGLANRILARFSRKVFLQPGSDLELPVEKAVRLNNPVRNSFHQIKAWQTHEKPLKVLVLGGSQGSQSVNRAIYDILDLFKELGMEVVHQTGERNLESVRSRYLERKIDFVTCKAFFNDLPQRLEEADLVIARAGAMTVAELGVAGRATIFIPLSISRAHQGENVRELEERGAVLVCKDDKDLSSELEKKLRQLNGGRGQIAKLAQEFRDYFRGADQFPEQIIGRELIEVARKRVSPR